MERTLLLNATYEPLRVISWKKAITLLTLGKVEVVEEYDREIRSVSFSIKLPSIVRLLRFVRWRKRSVKFCRQNIYIRDRFTCQYCGQKFGHEDLTYDHVIPRSQGGLTVWDNIVTACISCNREKGGQTPVRARMRLIKPPRQPDWLPALTVTFGVKYMPKSWRDYLYWTVELES